MLVGTGVPSFEGEIDAGAKRHRVVDDHDFLMMHRTDRVRAVDGEVHSFAADLVQQRHGCQAEPDAVEGR